MAQAMADFSRKDSPFMSRTWERKVSRSTRAATIVVFSNNSVHRKAVMALSLCACGAPEPDNTPEATPAPAEEQPSEAPPRPRYRRRSP